MSRPPESGSGEPVPAPTSERALEALNQISGHLEAMRTYFPIGYAGSGRVLHSKILGLMDTVRAALGSARPPLPPQEMPAEFADEWAGRLWVRLITIDGPETNEEAEDAAKFIRDVIAAYEALRVRGEPSREPTLEEIVRQTELIISAEFRLPASSDHEIAALVDLVRARLSSPEAPR